MAVIPEMTLQSGLFILMLLIARSFLKKRLPAAIRYALWAVPALRLLIPLSFKSVLGQWQHVPKPQLSLIRGAVSAGPLPSAAPALPATEIPSMTGTSPAVQAWTPSLETLLPLIWLSGSLVMLIVFIRVNLRFYRSIKGAVAVGGIDSPLPVMLTTKNISPCLAGLIRPRILMPGHVLASPELTRMVILHEVTHYRHKDHLFTVLRSLLLILWWWNPLIWALVRLSREDCEAACDEGVIRRMTLAQRKDYGKSLVALLRSQHANPAILFAGTAMGGSKKIIKERITMIANWKQKGRLATLTAVLAVLLLVPFLFSSAQTTGALPADFESVIARRYASFSFDEQLRILRALDPLLGREGFALQQPWEEAARKVTEAIREQVEGLLKAQSDPLKWADSDKAAVLDALAAAFGEAGYPLPMESLDAREKAQRLTDLIMLPEAPADEEEGESWREAWQLTLASSAFRTVGGKVAFKKEWAPKAEELMKSGVTLPENGDLRYLLGLDFQMPAPGSLSEAEALAKARAAILDKKGWKQEDLDHFLLWSSAYLMEKDGTPVYWFAFSWDEDKLLQEGKIDAQEEQRLIRAFPLAVFAKINAKTGGLYSFTETFDLETPFNRTI